jgi:preprotein translocase subunit SecE
MTTSAKKRQSRFKFVTDIIAELKKVVWPTRQEALRLTVLVLIVCLAAGLILGGLDYGFFRLVNWLR